jgi:benzoate-CoA ligase family protein
MPNAVTALLDDHVAAGDGARTVIVTPAGRASYADLLARSGRFGNALRGLGVEPEQRVAILLPDGLDWAAAFLGALRIGAVAVPLNTRLAPDRWAAMLADCRARVVVADPGAASALEPRLSTLPRCRLLTPDAARRAVVELAPEPVADEDMAFWLYTSGTTGPPRAAVHLHRDLLAGRGYGEGVLGVTREDRIFSTSKLFFAYALGNALLIPLAFGAPTYLHPAWAEPATVAEVMAAFAPTLLFSVPTFYARLVRAELPADTFRTLRIAVSAGERLPREVSEAWRERFGIEILDGLGATETIFMVLSNRPGRVRPGSAGPPVPGTDARVLDASGREAPDGVEGILHVRAPSVSPFYWRRLADSRRAFVGDWFRTGDVCVRDADGSFRHLGREDDLFKVAGLWVSPADIEGALLGHPAVADVAVVGVPAGDGLVKPVAFVVPRDGARDTLTDELRALAERTLAPHARPREIRLTAELPRTATGKLQRFLLREGLGA